jgi:coniferyl-aldehyde dehydrogenase
MTTQPDQPPDLLLVQIESLRAAFDREQRAFRQYAPLGHAKRVDALDALLQSIFRYEDILVEAANTDFGQRSFSETRLLDIFPVVDEIRYVKRNLRRWMQARRVSVNWQFLPSRAKIIYQPLGVVGIIGAWNYPILLTLSPLINALAAGNHVMVKPSEQAPATAAALQQMIREAFPDEYVTVTTGGSAVAEAFASLPFDHLLYTGSARVGKLIMEAAAENLTPVTLELGGKSPALVHESYSMAAAADRICSAKFWNAGQTCVAPDYALVPSAKLNEFVGSCLGIIAKRFSRPFSNADYTHMISERAWQRMHDLVNNAQSNGAQVIQPRTENENSGTPSRVFAPTLVVEAKSSMRVMQEEIFGPILPIVTYSSLDDAIEFINGRPRPLALYYFDRNRSRISKVLEQTVSGGVTVNDCIFHLPQHSLPFGGVGPSGMGAYHGFDGFTAFSKKKGVLLQNALVGWALDRAFKPPYTAKSDRLMAFLLGRSKPGNIRRMTLTKEK